MSLNHDRLRWYLGNIGNNNIRYAIYGAGCRGQEILNLAIDQKLKMPDIIFDDNPQFDNISGIKVERPDATLMHNLDEIILGTDRYQETMRKTILEISKNPIRITDIFQANILTLNVDTFSEFMKTELSNQNDKLARVINQLLNRAQNQDDSKYFFMNEAGMNFAVFLELKNKLVSQGIPLVEEDIDIPDFKKWIEENKALTDHYKDAGKVWIQKCLEHYLASKESKLYKNGTVIDIASAGSVFSEKLREKGFQAYSLDISYPTGFNGYRIGSDASHTGLPDGFADLLCLQCAFECFSGNADSAFIEEAERILKPGARLFIVPLYINHEHINFSSPFSDLSKIRFDTEAKRVWRRDEWNESFSRHYSPESLLHRIFQYGRGLDKELVFYRNFIDIMHTFEGQLCYCGFALRAIKKV